MLHATFHRLLRGISADREASLWKRGILNWEDFEARAIRQGIRFSYKHVLEDERPFARSRLALKTGDSAYFARLLDRREHYRIALAFPKKVLFLDIETTGLSRYYDVITLVGWFYQGKYRVLVQGGDATNLRAALADAGVIVTFNGSLFDLPFLREGFTDLPIPPAHIDLRFLSKRVGLAGGQKTIEEIIGFRRPPDLANIKGETAPILWHQYRRGDLDALKLLVKYNHCDVEGMRFIFDEVVERLLKLQQVPRRIRDGIPQFFIPSKLALANGRNVRGISSGIKLTPYNLPAVAPITLADLSPKGGTDALRVVGIDLTGSENRPSGWCLLDGSKATTCSIKDDETLISDTLAARPHLVSIDSPLSLPKGRVSVSDDDPGRKEYGIMRYCERALKKRGVNVYPALIPSMQKLTARGIQLAARLRKLGVPVIESYPGAAQDIMGIPRKRASLDMLRDGLAEFGIRGAYQKTQVSHDELDAITAAVVGVFFWSGKFESLGDEDEEALIIPDLKADAAYWQKRQVIGLSGAIAAGKTTIARHLESQGFYYTRYSMVLDGLMRAQGKKVSRTVLQKYGEKVHRELGQRWLGRKLLETLPATGTIVIDGLRFPEDHAFLAETFGPAFYHIHVEAAEDLRKARFESREVEGAPFKKAQAHPVEQQSQLLRPLAHMVLPNEGTLQHLHSCVDELISNSVARLECQ